MLDISDGREYRTFELRQAEASHKLTGYAIVFDSETEIDRDPYTGTTYLEKIDRRALDTCDMSDVILNIDHQGPPLARTKAGSLTLTPDDHGLRVDATLSTTRGRELWEDVVAGNLSQMSFAFTVDAEDYDSRNHLRTIQKIGKIWDVSVVTRAAYPQTEIYARSSMAGHMEQERRAVVEATLAELRSAVAKDPPLTREKVMENRSDLGAALLDLYRRSELTAKLAEIRSWEPEGRPEDAQTAREKSKQLQEVIQELEDIDREIADKLEKRGKHGQYGDDDGPGYRLYPSDLAVFVCRDILTGRGCAPIGRSEAMVNARGLGADKLRWIARACDADEDEVVRKYLTNNKEEKPEPPAPLSTLSTQKNLNQRRNFAMESIETRALQSYLCKGVSNMTEDERRALTTTGSGSATIPTAIVDRLISTAGLSILTHRATHLADGRPGKLVIPVAPAAGGVGWHQELADISVYDQSLSSITLSGAELVKLVAGSRAMIDMSTDNFETYLINLLAGEVLDVLEDSYVTGKAGTNNCPGDGLDNLTLTGRTVTATTAITVADIAQALALLPAKVQRGGLVLANASTLAGILMEKTTYAFDPSTTLQSLGLELVQDPHVSDNTVYVVGALEQTLFLNFWQNINVRRSEDAMLVKNAIAFLASCVCGFAWNSNNVAKVSISA